MDFKNFYYADIYYGDLVSDRNTFLCVKHKIQRLTQ